MNLKRTPVTFLLTLIMILQGAVLCLTAFAGTNKPYITEYGLYKYVDSDTEAPAVVDGNVKYTGNTGSIYTTSPWPVLTGVPYVFSDDVVIGIKFATNLSTPAYYEGNITKFRMYDASNNPIAINVKRSGSGTGNNKDYLYITPNGSLQPSSTYKIIVVPGITSNNGQSAGIQQEVDFTTAAMEGDVNGDYRVDILDLLWMSQYLGNTLDGDSLQADFNKDNQVNILDLLEVENLSQLT